MIQHILDGLTNCLELKNLLVMFFAVPIGILVGVLPGFGATTGIAILLPVTFGMGLEPTTAFLLLISIFMAAEYGGSLSAILINTPGTAAAVCTTFDGYPMAKNGKGLEAIYYSLSASTLGGFFGAVILLFFTPALAKFSLRFGPAETFWLAACGLALVGTLSSGNMLKGISSAAIGILLGCVGMDPLTGHPRFTFGVPELRSGLEVMAALLGFFAVPQALSMLEIKEKPIVQSISHGFNSFFKIFRDVLRYPMTLLKSAIIGTIVGIIPGAGASIATFISYGEAKRCSKNPQKFGTGIPEGIICSEASNNALVGGALVPLLAFGIPGNAAAAVLLGGLAIYGLRPGISLFTEQAPFVYTIFVGLFFTVFVMLAWGATTIRVFTNVLKVKPTYMVGPILVLVLIGVYSIRYQHGDMYALALFGILAFFLMKLRFSLPAIVLGLILGHLVEDNLRQAISIGESHGNVWKYFFSSKIDIVLILVTFFLISMTIFKELNIVNLIKKKKNELYGG
ncbi:MAG: tripartite tricarboxylate transporter permease [Peptococcaceae bacterium]